MTVTENLLCNPATIREKSLPYLKLLAKATLYIIMATKIHRRFRLFTLHYYTYIIIQTTHIAPLKSYIIHNIKFHPYIIYAILFISVSYFVYHNSQHFFLPINKYFDIRLVTFSYTLGYFAGYARTRT